MGVRRSILFFQDCSPFSRHNCLVFEKQVGEWGRERGMTSFFLSVVIGMDTPKSDRHLNSKYMHMIGDLYLKVVNERRQKTEKNCR